MMLMLLTPAVVCIRGYSYCYDDPCCYDNIVSQAYYIGFCLYIYIYIYIYIYGEDLPATIVAITQPSSL